ncbi:putative beta-1,4-mannosyl-glycoprotein beta-1,4-N-acetylglucosaminyltransferase [Cavenderia fasciculata]|uniref:Beta-1,4-mannosyl-glycoprotein beta-1,4-N-acetylglucosaminyltransferase n=1 Tax=Cavenderia fasciculata TaxID=261658 RepID=F4PLL7_CACFS|nr:putative beta-1,4-mannosyl-glycoprotein beta-1,4-N-acetylglucosaminyltransferase [Cavenderia fasciculata]EGG23439.1 putative beta-1,4-mannosyl-glycoprotein beta-1,4-N-acetylglucosaminyltransferase [Cavenderia fasciculata]|eukprot:XP_004361290.1 putative beta-1,4-mannosyl-glycoprotein beta-1,4-N-acetylglucosaminyltransferase [Cavenderia fasciculata]
MKITRLKIICIGILITFGVYMFTTPTNSRTTIVVESGVNIQPQPSPSRRVSGFSNKPLNFKKDMETFPWQEFRSAVQEGRVDETDDFSQMLITKLVPYILQSPRTPINDSCTPEPLPTPEHLDCAVYPNVFTGKLRDKPARIGHMVQIGFDIDVLEIHLNELHDMVDDFFIIESTSTHFHKLKKPLMWEHVKLQDRFAKFSDKVVHFALDDADLTVGNELFSAEAHQEKRRWQKFVEWNAHKGNLYGDSDIIGFGDTDEITRRLNVHLLKHCQLQDNVKKIDIGIWFPYGPINQVFNPYWHVPGNNYALGDPTFYVVGEAKKEEAPSRNRGQSGHFLLGGMHMTHYGYLPYQIIKKLSCTECGIKSMPQLSIFADDLETGNISQLELKLLQPPDDFKNRIRDISTMDQEFRDRVAILPWFYNCNRNRYPVWESKNDKRLQVKKSKIIV